MIDLWGAINSTFCFLFWLWFCEALIQNWSLSMEYILHSLSLLISIQFQDKSLPTKMVNSGDLNTNPDDEKRIFVICVPHYFWHRAILLFSFSDKCFKSTFWELISVGMWLFIFHYVKLSVLYRIVYFGRSMVRWTLCYFPLPGILLKKKCQPSQSNLEGRN